MESIQVTASDANRQLMQHIFSELSLGNSRPFIDRLADDVSWIVMGQTPWSKIYRGKPAVLSELLGALRARLADRYKPTAERIIADGEFVVVQARGNATTKTGLPHDNQYCFIYRIVDGTIKEVTEYLDTELVTSALTATS